MLPLGAVFPEEEEWESVERGGAVLSEQSSPIMERKPEVGSKVTETLQILFSGLYLVSRHFLSSYKLVLLLAGRRC